MTEKSDYIQEKINILGSLAMKSTEVIFHVPRGIDGITTSAGDKEILDLINHIKKYEINTIDIEEKKLERIVRIR